MCSLHEEGKALRGGMGEIEERYADLGAHQRLMSGNKGYEGH